MRDAVRTQNGEVLKMTAHSLKGSSLTVGAQRLGGLCRQLEDEHCKETDQPALIAALDEEFTRVRKAFGDL
jgi:HPt (histidine-containing phosphotransfer) domain-containing protein